MLAPHAPVRARVLPAGVGRKGTYLYNLPESQSGHKYLGVPSVSARFGTDPFVWNWAMWLTARLVPRALLADRQFVRSFARLADPLVRAVDKVAGEVVVSCGGGCVLIDPCAVGSWRARAVQS